MTKEQKKVVEKTYQEVYKEWGRSRYKRVNYRNKLGYIRIRERDKDKKVIYFIELEFYEKGKYFPIRTSIESIHYDKVIAKFKRFVDEYCTDWVVKAILQYKGYEIKICREAGSKDFYFGSIQFHKNSTFKHIADTREEVEICCKNRIDKVIYEKEKVSRVNQVKSGLAKGARNKKIKELEELLVRISTQLEELKKEKDTLTYKGVVLEVEQGKDDTWVFVGKIRNAPENKDVRSIPGDTMEEVQRDFEEYVDWLEEKAYIYNMIRPEIKK